MFVTLQRLGRTLLLTVAISGVVGVLQCNAQAAAKYARLIASFQSGQSCIKRAADGTRYAALKAHTSLISPLLIDGVMISDEQYITPTELEQLKAWRADLSVCKRQIFEGFVSEMPDLQLAMINQEVKSVERVRDLASGKMSWGQYNSDLIRAIPEMRADTNRLLMPLAQAAQAEQVAQARNQPGSPPSVARSVPSERETGSRSALPETVRQIGSGLLALAKLAVEIDAISAANRPVFTSCSRLGPTTNCVTH